MAHNKPRAKKIRLNKKTKQNRLPPIWTALKKFGIRGIKAAYLWRNRMNSNVQRHWRRNNLKE